MLASYQRFREDQSVLTKESQSKKYKDVCDLVRKSRRDEFIQEAEDVADPKPAETSTA